MQASLHPAQTKPMAPGLIYMAELLDLFSLFPQMLHLPPHGKARVRGAVVLTRPAKGCKGRERERGTVLGMRVALDQPGKGLRRRIGGHLPCLPFSPRTVIWRSQLTTVLHSAYVEAC